MPPLTQKTALITGAAAPRGIGRAIALKLASLGADVVVTDVAGSLDLDGVAHDRLALIDALASDLRAMGTRALAMPLDVTDPAAVQSGVARTLSDFGRLDILVNNAGSLAGSEAFLSTTPDQWDASFRVNLLGPMMMSQAAIPVMQAQGGGRIIMIGSTGSLGAEAGFGAYTAMKHGLVGLAKTLAAEFGKDGIRCNTVSPGHILTEASKASVSPEMSDVIISNNLIPRAGRGEDLAQAVLYLVSDESSFVTGQLVSIDGGQMAHLPHYSYLTTTGTVTTNKAE